MASFVKSKLKAARDAIAKKNYELARDAANDVLSYEPENYNAHVFLAFAQLELGQHEQSEQAYNKAIASNPDQLLARQGIGKLYERTGQWNKFIQSSTALMNVYSKSGDTVKCAETIQKHIEVLREHGTKLQLVEGLQLFLPGSTLYSTLSELPIPDPTAPTATTTFAAQTAIHNSLPVLEEIISIIEKAENDSFKKEVDKRRMRLGAPSPDEVRKEVGREIWSVSKLPHFFEEIMNHPNTSDELRRATESKLLSYKQHYQQALPNSGELGKVKAQLGKEIKSLIDGIVLLNIPNESAWVSFIESQDVDATSGYDFSTLKKFMTLFPETPLTRMLQAYFYYIGERGLDEDGEGEDELPPFNGEEEDSYEVILEAFGSLEDSLVAYRIVADVYITEVDYTNAIKTAESALKLLQRKEAHTGVILAQVRKGFKITLATGLVHLYPPKHHSRATPLIDEVLKAEPENVQSLMNKAYVCRYAKQWPEAASIFHTVTRLTPTEDERNLEAEEEYGWSLVQQGEYESGAKALRVVLEKRDAMEGMEEEKARVWWRLGRCLWDQGGSSREDSYRHFITSLKRFSTFAPAFTSLGIYYLEISSPPDPTRASKCFQKAFELDARETVAAQKLIEGFAEEMDWDLVDVVARRTIQGEGGLEGGIASDDAKAAAMVRKPTNAWAWKAIGIVEMTRRNYPAAITAFQTTLRADENDALTWLRLGEAYLLAGRHAAALKALLHSLELQPSNWLCTYQIGEVQRQSGQYAEAIQSFRDILQLPDRATESGVLTSLAETLLAQGRFEKNQALLCRAEASFVESVEVSLKLIESSHGFRRIGWKSVFDALMELAEFSGLSDEEALMDIFQELEPVRSSASDERVTNLLGDGVFLTPEDRIDGLSILKVAVATCSYRLTLYTNEDTSTSSAWFDFGVACYRLSGAAYEPALKEKAHREAIEYVRRALIANPNQTTYWTVFGNLNFKLRPKIAQHAYIKALEYNPKDAAVWGNLGLLYLNNNDRILANEAFFRAQTLDPDYTVAWVGQGLVATANGHEVEARALFEHAVTLSADVPEADLEFATRAFKRLGVAKLGGGDDTNDQLLNVFFALNRHCLRKSDNPTALHLFGLVCERIGHEDLAIQNLSKAISILETSYEHTEDPVIERRYATTNVNLGRLYLSSENYSDALGVFELALGLLEQEGDEDAVKLKTMCQLGTGLAQYHLGDSEASIATLETALDTTTDELHGHVAVLLARALWEIGSAEGREAAKTQLFECINLDPSNLEAVTALAGMGLLSDDEALLDAALAEMVSLPAEEQRQRDPGRYAEMLLKNYSLAQGDIPRAVSLAAKSLHNSPTDLRSRLDLASLSILEGNTAGADALISSSNNNVQLSSFSSQICSIGAVASLLSGSSERSAQDALRLSQRAVKLAPWDSSGWGLLAAVRNLVL